MRYTQYRGLAKIKMELTLLFGCMNLKKMANWKWKQRHTSLLFIIRYIEKWKSGLEALTSNPLCLRSDEFICFFQHNYSS